MTFKAPIVAGMGFLFVFMNLLIACLAVVSVVQHPPTRAFEFSEIELNGTLSLAMITLICTFTGTGMGLNLMSVASGSDQRSLHYRSLGKWYVRLSLIAGSTSIIFALIIAGPILLGQGPTP